MEWQPLEWTQADQEWMDFQREMAQHLIRVFEISPFLLGVRVVEGSVEKDVTAHTAEEEEEEDLFSLEHGVGPLS